MTENDTIDKCKNCIYAVFNSIRKTKSDGTLRNLTVFNCSNPDGTIVSCKVFEPKQININGLQNTGIKSLNNSLVYDKALRDRVLYIKSLKRNIRKTREEKRKMKGQVEADKEYTPIEDGMHFGKITKVEERKVEQYNAIYLDVYIAVDDTENAKGEPVELKAGYNAYVCPSSQLGQLFARLGIPLEIGKVWDTQDFIGKRVQFQTIQKEGKNDRLYANIIKESVKLEQRKKK